MYKTLNISSILCIRYASWIFSKILKALLIWWVKENNGLGISARKEEILRSVRFAKYKPSNFRQQFKLEHNMFSSWVFGLFVGFVLVFFNSPFFFFFFSLSVPRAAQWDDFVLLNKSPRPIQWQHTEEWSHWGRPTFKPPGKLTGEW